MMQGGIILVLSGLIKKMVFADRFAVVSDGYFTDPAAHSGAGWPHGPVASLSSCKSFSISLVTPISLAVVPSCWASSFHLILHGHSWPEIRPTSGRGGI
jgi:hypothetical protein